MRNFHFIRCRLFRSLHLHSGHKGLGHEVPTVLRIKWKDALPFELIDRYARRMFIKNTIKNTIDYFSMEALPATVSMKLNPDLQTMLMADGLCRISETHLGKGLEDAKVGTPYVCVRRGQNCTFIISLGRQANYPRLLVTGYVVIIESIHWLDDHNYRYGSFETVSVLSIECVLN